jgi:hypothetical protein
MVFFPNIEVDFIRVEEGVLIKKKSTHISPVQRIYDILINPSSTDYYLIEV